MGYQVKMPTEIKVVFNDIKDTLRQGKDLRVATKAIKNNDIYMIYFSTLKLELDDLFDKEIADLNQKQLEYLVLLKKYYPIHFLDMLTKISVGQQARFKRHFTDMASVNINTDKGEAARSLAESFDNSILIVHNNLGLNKTSVEDKNEKELLE